MSTKFNPKIRSSIVSVGEVFDAIKDPEGYVRPTTRIENLTRALDRGTDSTVMRSMGYENLFETFEKKGINKVTINKFKNIPDITDFLGKDGKLTDANINKYNNALKKFRLDAFKGLSPKDIRIIESSGFLSQFAKDQRNQILKSGGKFNQKNLNKVLDQMFDFTFKDLDTAAGVKNPQIQDKKITKAMDKVDANKNIKPAQKLNIKFGLSQVDKLVKMGNNPAAKKLLTAILTLAPKELFGMDLLIPTTMGSGELPEEGTPEYEQLMKDMGKNQGGMMDINFMTRPLGYKDGTRDGTTVGDLETANTSKAMTGEAVDALRSLVAPQVLKKMNDNTTTFPIAEIASMFLRDQGLEVNEQNMGLVTNIIQNKLIPEEQDKLREMGTDDLTKLIRGGFNMATTGKEKVSQGIQSLMDMFRRE